MGSASCLVSYKVFYHFDDTVNILQEYFIYRLTVVYASIHDAVFIYI